MAGNIENEPMLDMYMFETAQLLERLEQMLLSSEKSTCFTYDAINEIFRIMHTIKGSSAMMLFNGIATIAHSIEDLFYYLREEKPQNVDCPQLSDMLLDGVDFIKVELEKVKNRDNADGDASDLIQRLRNSLSLLKESNPSSKVEAAKEQIDKGKQKYYISPKKTVSLTDENIYKGVIYFEENCGMESIRAFTIVNSLKDLTGEIAYVPEDIIDSDSSDEIIQKDGFTVYLKTDATFDNINRLLQNTPLLRDLELSILENEGEYKHFFNKLDIVLDESPEIIPRFDNVNLEKREYENETQAAHHQVLISVNVEKLDMLMNLVGELVISEAMVTQNPDLKGLTLDNFQKTSRHLRKITSELQDTVMSVRMVSISPTFLKMNRVVRDMCKKLNKEIHLELIGEETEVDKNILEHISDPLMHLIRNAIDHGIEAPEEREKSGKPQTATITLEARNAGSDVLIIVGDDGGGLDRERILEKARENGLIHKTENELTDKEIYSYIFMPGFSTKENVTEFSGRGVGLDVVTKNVESVGGTVSIDSTLGKGTAITMKIPLTLAIIDGMNIKVGNSCYTIPTISIKQSFRAKEKDIITDPDGNEMIMVRGQCCTVLRLYELFKVKTNVTHIPDGIIIMVENEGNTLCLFADELIGEQQVVVKALPSYIRNIKKIRGLSGCTLLGDGSISLILNVAGLFSS